MKRARRGECVACGEKLSPQTIPECGSYFQEVSITFVGLPCLGCTTPGHPRRFANMEFGERLIDAIFETGEFPAGKRRPLGGLSCRNCGALMKTPRRQGGSVSQEFSFPGLPTFSVTVSGPMIRCSDCGMEQIFADRETGHRIGEAMTNAFRQANLNP